MAVAVAVAVAVGVGVGEGVVHKLTSVVHEAPSEGQQKLCVPHAATCPTFPIFEQLISWGVPSAFGELQLLSKSCCPGTGHC